MTPSRYSRPRRFLEALYLLDTQRTATLAIGVDSWRSMLRLERRAGALSLTLSWMQRAISSAPSTEAAVTSGRHQRLIRRTSWSSLARLTVTATPCLRIPSRLSLLTPREERSDGCSGLAKAIRTCAILILAPHPM